MANSRQISSFLVITLGLPVNLSFYSRPDAFSRTFHIQGLNPPILDMAHISRDGLLTPLSPWVHFRGVQ